jgi:predicted signal transduction protein with EAL and GGDEF domain
VHKLFAHQVAKATSPAGAIDVDVLGSLVVAAYEQAERDRKRNERAIAMMVEEVDQLNRGLEKLVEQRTAELRAREAELEERNFRFDAAINHMSQGLLMFDAEARLVICNRRYVEIYGLALEFAQPGVPLAAILRQRAAMGTFSGDPDEYIAFLKNALAQGENVTRVMELPDGRTIAVVNHPMPDGGWVATHEDITERRRADRQIAHMARHDSLTDLPNRVLLSERLSEALAAAAQHNQTLAVLYLDLDHFKGVNDTLGHSVGDELLKAIANRLRS